MMNSPDSPTGCSPGGLETTASMLALGTLLLLQNPDARDAVRDRDEALNPIIEELLRYLTVVQVAFPRVAHVKTEIGGKTISPGDIVLCSSIRLAVDPDDLPYRKLSFR
jgi:cytochrome P450